MEENTQLDLAFPSVRGKKVAVDFGGGVVTSDAGLLFLRETERKVGIIDRLTGCLRDHRDPLFIVHTMKALMTQRIMQIACGYEDADDSDTLRCDPALKIACGRQPLSGNRPGQPTHDIAP